MLRVCSARRARAGVEGEDEWVEADRGGVAPSALIVLTPSDLCYDTLELGLRLGGEHGGGDDAEDLARV